MAEEEVGFRLALKNRREVERGVHQVGDEFDRVGDEAIGAGRKARIGARGLVSFGNTGKVAGRAIVTGFGAASVAIVGTGVVLSKLAKDSIGEAREAQKVGAITRAEIKATGRAANISAKGVGNLAGAISAKTGVDDEQIQSGANMILTFKNVRNEVGKGNRIFDRANRGAVNLAKAGFGSIVSQSKTLAKALNDPIKGMGALGKSGVTFTEQQIKRVGQFVKENKLLGAQKIILGEVESQVGGVAAAQATWGEKAAVSWGNIQETLGTALLPMLDRTQRWFVQKGGPALEGYVGIFERKGIPKIKEFAGVFERRAIPAISDFVDEARPLAESVFPAIGSAAGTTADAFKIIAPRAKQVFDGFNNLPDWAKSAIAITAGGAAVGKKAGAFSLGKSVLGGITSKAPLPVIVTNPGFGGGAGRGNPWARPTTAAPAAAAGLTGGQAAAGASIFAGGVASEYVLQRQLRAGIENSMSSRSSVVRGGGTVRADVLSANQAGEEIWRASLAKNWPEVIRLAREYKDVLKGSATGQQQLQRAGYMFTSAFGRDLQGVIARLDTADAAANNLRTSLLGIPAVGSYGNGMGVLAPASPKRRPKKRGGTSFPSVDPVQPLGDDYFGRQAGGDTHVYIDGEEVSSRVERRWQNRQARG